LDQSPLYAIEERNKEEELNSCRIYSYPHFINIASPGTISFEENTKTYSFEKLWAVDVLNRPDFVWRSEFFKKKTLKKFSPLFSLDAFFFQYEKIGKISRGGGFEKTFSSCLQFTVLANSKCI